MRSYKEHDILVNLILNLSLSITTTESPVAENGVLKKDYGYVYEINKIEEEFETIFGKGFKPSDGFLKNESKKTSMTVECKSYCDDGDSRLIEQLLFYGNNNRFLETLNPGNLQNEILVVCYKNEELVSKTLKNIAIVKNYPDFETNIVLWTVDKIPGSSDYRIEKKEGTHINDNALEKKMSSGGFVVSPSPSLLLITPETPENALVAQIAKRILVCNTASDLKEIKIGDFIKRQNDKVLPDKKMTSLIKASLKLIPELGTVANDKIMFKKSLRVGKIKDKIDELDKCTKQEYLNILSNNKTLGRKKSKKKLDKSQKTITVFFEDVS
ncbi:MAG: hypothetical protein KJ600_06580 [Nanoarchaeota archaeon]|nr:hypothetical protein [Nanoarchaeota archaeon]MBU1104190.1 hypothetical protein [Nanoarchaeota archaeon]